MQEMRRCSYDSCLKAFYMWKYYLCLAFIFKVYFGRFDAMKFLFYVPFNMEKKSRLQQEVETSNYERKVRHLYHSIPADLKSMPDFPLTNDEIRRNIFNDLGDTLTFQEKKYFLKATNKI